METLISPFDMFLITTVALKKKKVVTSQHERCHFKPKRASCVESTWNFPTALFVFESCSR